MELKVLSQDLMIFYANDSCHFEETEFTCQILNKYIRVPINIDKLKQTYKHKSFHAYLRLQVVLVEETQFQISFKLCFRQRNDVACKNEKSME